MAHIVAMSGRDDLVDRTRTNFNLSRIDEMNDPELIGWANENGLTLAELTEIQPGYVHENETLGWLAVSVASIGLASFAIAVIGLLKRSWERFGRAATVVSTVMAIAASVLSRLHDGGRCGSICSQWIAPVYLGRLAIVLWIAALTLIAAWIRRRASRA